MTRSEIINGLKKIEGFFTARADMAVGDGKMQLMSLAVSARDAAEALKEMEPRKLTIDEYRRMAELPRNQRRPVWVEWLDQSSGSWSIPQRGYEGYGVTWRAWTGEPGT